MEIPFAAKLIKRALRDVYFINGTAYAGKSTAVRMLAERCGGICCGENYHEALMDAIDEVHQPNLSYFSTMRGWQAFLNRTPEEYVRWIDGASREAAPLEIILLLRLSGQGKPVFVDTNIPLDILWEISDDQHVAILLSDQRDAVERFFDRLDPEKQFLLTQIARAENPEATMENFRRCIARANSPERYRAFLESGFFTHVRDECLTPEDTFAILAKHFHLDKGENDHGGI